MRFHHEVKFKRMLEMKASFFYVAVIILKLWRQTERHNKDVKCQILKFIPAI